MPLPTATIPPGDLTDQDIYTLGFDAGYDPKIAWESPFEDDTAEDDQFRAGYSAGVRARPDPYGSRSDVAPAWFDPTYAGERWDDDY
ncbi:MAG TPA: hypothetical protein VMX12_03165 [Acidimicrobiia bacterium]|nr:hypothetical protein [Acidimicrobiia bacterium]